MKKDKIEKKEVIRYIISRYKFQIAILVVLGFLGATVEGIGISAVVPTLSFILGGVGQVETSIISESVRSFFSFLSIPFTFRYLIVVIIGLFIFRSFILGLFTYIRARIGADFINSEMENILSLTLRARWPFLLKKKIGYIQNTIIWDVRRSSSFLDVFTQIIQSLTGFLIYLVVALSISVNITMVTIVAGAFMFLVLKPLIRKTHLINEKTSMADKELSHYITENLNGLKVIKAAGEEGHIFGKAKKYFSSLRKLYVRNLVILSLGGIFFQPFSVIFIIGVFYFVYNTPGFSLATFAATLYLIQKIFIYLQSGQSAIQSIGGLLPYAENLIIFKHKLSNNIEEEISEHKSFKFKNSIEFKDIDFTYDNDIPVILKGISFFVSKGEMVGLIGPSGAGKSSIADLFIRLLIPTRGEILIDGVKIQSISIAEWRSNIGYVSQDVFLINDTIRSNIQFYNNSLSQEDIIRATKQAHIYDFISGLPNGFDTLIGDHGVMLSVGQRQRIVLARVLARRPSILILDEATSSLDFESEKLIHDAITELKGHVTVFIIAHRLTTIMNVDRLLVLNGGKIVEEGTPYDLFQNKNSYFYKANKGHIKES